MTTFLIKNESEVGIPPWKLMKGIMPTMPFVSACSILENHNQCNHCHNKTLDDEQKEILIMEKALFNDFWENENKISTNEIEIVIFNRTVKGVKSEMTKTKTDKIIKTLRGNVKSLMACSNKHLDDLMNLTDSVGIVVVKVGCSPVNKNFLLDGFVKEKSIFTRSLSKDHFLSACMDDCLLA